MFYNNFIKLCDDNNIKPTPLLNELEISKGNLASWKSGAVPNTDVLSKLSKRFGVSVNSLLGMTDLVEVQYNGVRSWARNTLFTPDETAAIEDHFQELLGRYKELVNIVCNMRMGKVDIDLDEIRDQTEYVINSMHSWIGRLPEYFFGEYRSKQTDIEEIIKKATPDWEQPFDEETIAFARLFSHLSAEDRVQMLGYLSLLKQKDTP